ncbi:uncharacterized protein PHACADRAFT_201776 [Phanerochaete carnosa HHB-10118-sp]|uniref:Uncharacterized protein n=1 Tax=Phanerochaete carnosa (strain HHB-10118-sp) TaxID=650164 RepID=K5WGN5_PHACS|nr:uncharacterized protein PHACADRAFT_201776 [Phanerochaete carnosa HHB-10118-sp]EKM49332.1 hypothetical protein PHACADRAFT_201776 [Phanerochaete carnosa HHB-10118-sp]
MASKYADRCCGKVDFLSRLPTTRGDISDTSSHLETDGQLVVHMIASNVADPLNTSSHTHAQTLALPTTQWKLPSFPFHSLLRVAHSSGAVSASVSSDLRGQNADCHCPRTVSFGSSEETLPKTSGGGSSYESSLSASHSSLRSPDRKPPPPRPQNKGIADLPAQAAISSRFCMLQIKVSEPSRHIAKKSSEKVCKSHIGLARSKVLLGAPRTSNKSNECLRLEAHILRQVFCAYVGSQEAREKRAKAIRDAGAPLLIFFDAIGETRRRHSRATAYAHPIPPMPTRELSDGPGVLSMVGDLAMSSYRLSMSILAAVVAARWWNGLLLLATAAHAMRVKTETGVALSAGANASAVAVSS